MTRGLLLFDADCGFCTASARQVARLAERGWLRLRVQALQSVDLGVLGVDAERAVREIPYVDANGRVSYGHRAFAAALATGPLLLRLLGRVLVAGPVDTMAATAYRLIAANRNRLPGGTAACALPDQQR